jgi:hypothetical protein
LIKGFKSGSIKRFIEDDVFVLGSEGNLGSGVIVE